MLDEDLDADGDQDQAAQKLRTLVKTLPHLLADQQPDRGEYSRRYSRNQKDYCTTL